VKRIDLERHASTGVDHDRSRNQQILRLRRMIVPGGGIERRPVTVHAEADHRDVATGGRVCAGALNGRYRRDRRRRI